MNPFSKPPFFAPDSVSDSGLTIQVIDEEGQAHPFHVAEALALIEKREMTERYGDLGISTREFEALGLSLPAR